MLQQSEICSRSDPLPYTIHQLVIVSPSNVPWALVGWTYLVSCSFSCKRCFRWLCRSSLSCWRSTNTTWFECSNWACSVDTLANSASTYGWYAVCSYISVLFLDMYSSIFSTFLPIRILEFFCKDGHLSTSLCKLRLYLCQLKRDVCICDKYR